jgi:menaquinone-dependent protoporphyrinogen oxidase
MDGKVLVTYASTHGSTQEIAEVIAEIIRERGLTVELKPARLVKDLAGYSAVVLGAPLYMFRLHSDARRFLTTHRSALEHAVPVSIFSGGPMEEGKDEQWAEVRVQLDKELAKFSWLKPASIEIVGGRFDPANLRFPWKFIPALKQMPSTDLRDWAAIRTWAEGLAAQYAGQANQLA